MSTVPRIVTPYLRQYLFRMLMSVKSTLKARMRWVGILFCFFLIRVIPAFPQSYKFRTFNSEDGLTQSYIYSISQDTHGHLWIGTGGGLSRYNGNTFENVNSSKYYIEDLEEVFCVAEYDNKENEYNVTNIYPFIESKEELIGRLYEMDLRKDNKLKVIRTGNIKKDYINYENFNNQKVLVINSFNQKLYISELKKYNLKVSGFDTYQENPLKIISKLTSYDIVICCTGTSRHYINTLIENTKDYYDENGERNNKYQFMENVTMSNLLNRINYAIENIK